MEFYKKLHDKKNKKETAKTNKKLDNTSSKKTSNQKPTSKSSKINSTAEKQSEPSKSYIENLIKIKHLVSQPKEDKPDKRYYALKESLDEPTVNETVKQERWATSTYCPECESTNIKIVLNAPGQVNKYKCNNCGHKFSDGSGAPFDGSSIPISIWIECWYLYGLTTSMEYIAHKVDLDVHIVRLIIQQLQKIFKVEQPLTKFLSKDKNYEEFYNKIAEQINAKRDELLGGPAVNQAKDTAEYRKLKDRQEEETGSKRRGRPKPRG